MIIGIELFLMTTEKFKEIVGEMGNITACIRLADKEGAMLYSFFESNRKSYEKFLSLDELLGEGKVTNDEVNRSLENLCDYKCAIFFKTEEEWKSGKIGPSRGNSLRR